MAKVRIVSRNLFRPLSHSHAITQARSSLASTLSRALMCTALLIPICAAIASAQDQAPLLLRDPSVSQTQIAFSFAGSIWIVGRDGGDARRLTTGGHEGNPIFSPDGAGRSERPELSVIFRVRSCFAQKPDFG